MLNLKEALLGTLDPRARGLATMTHPAAIYPDGSRCYSLVPTYKCNMNCAYCAPQNATDAYSLSELIIATDNVFSDFKGKIVYEIFGGEPLLEYDTVFKLLEYVMQKYDDRVVRYDIYTNATILNETILAFFHKYKTKRVMLCLSLDGAKEGNTDRSFKNGDNSYELVARNLQTILDIGIPTRVQFTAHVKNVAHISSGVKNLYSLGFRNIRVGIICKSYGTPRPEQRELLPDATFSTIFKEEMRKLYSFSDERPDLYLRNFKENDINRGPFKFEVTPGVVEVDEEGHALNIHVEVISNEVYAEYLTYLASKG